MQTSSIRLLFSLAVLAATAAKCQDLSVLDRRLNVAVLGFAWNEAAAKSALAAGANINHRNNGETLLTGAIKGQKDAAIIRFLLQNGIDRTAKDSSGLTALDLARKYKIGRSADGREILALLDAGASSAVSSVPQSRQPSPASTAPTTTNLPSTLTVGVYECINQMGIATPLSFGIVDGSHYTSSNGKRGTFAFDAASNTLTLDPGPSPARYRRISATTFRLLREDGNLGGFTCPLNSKKNPLRPPW